jgi:tetratricopeptide (TPR) repeat protein
VELNQENYKAFYYRGLTFQILQNYHRALEDFNQCLQLNPYQSETHYSRAQVYFHLGDYPKALSDCEQSLNIEPEAFQVQKFRELVRSYIHL